MRYLLALLVMLAACDSTPPAYEFRIASYPDDDMPMAMNRDGKDGWRPVSCRRAVDEVSPQTIVQARVTRALYECVMERPARQK